MSISDQVVTKCNDQFIEQLVNTVGGFMKANMLLSDSIPDAVKMYCAL